MITAITGMPGDGKTYYDVSQLLLERLIETERFQVTNVRLLRAETTEYVQRERAARKIETPFDFDSRCRIISDADAFEFYRFRSGDLVLPHSPDYELRESIEQERSSRRLTKLEHDRVMLEMFALMKARDECKLPVDYHIDEAHDIFPGREWSNGGRGILFYASKHRHLHDEIFLITQQIDQVEKQLRNLVSETVVVRNMTRRNVGLFRCKPGFKLKYFYGLPTPNSKPFAEPEIQLRVEGAAKCYKTTGALGVHEAPEKIINKGKFPMWVAYVAIAVAVVALGVAFAGLPALGALSSRAFVGGNVGASVAAATGFAAVKGAAMTEPTPRPTDVFPSVGEGGGRGEGESVRVRGVVTGHGRVNVVLTDGRVLSEGDPSLGFIGRNSVVVDGRRLYFVPVGPGKAAPAANREADANVSVDAAPVSARTVQTTAVPVAEGGGKAVGENQGTDGFRIPASPVGRVPPKKLPPIFRSP